MENVMIKNTTNYLMEDIYSYLSGITTKLRDKIEVYTDKGKYYSTLIIKPK